MTSRARTIVALGLATAITGGVLLWAAPPAGSPPPRPLVRRLHVRVWEAGAVAPSVSVNIPVTLVTVALKVTAMTGILDRTLEMAREHGREHCVSDMPVRVGLKGHEIVALWTAMTGSGPADLVSVEDGHGGRVQIRVD
jgi:hypothetical protein